MSLFIVDVESDGNVISRHSMICFGAVKLTSELNTTFYGQVKPISDEFIPDSLAISGFSREEHLKFDNPSHVMKRFADWINENTIGKPVLISDNNGYDYSWINYYFQVYYGSNPFGWSSRRISDLFCGAEHNLHYEWKKHRNTDKYPSNHNPLSDALSNASALHYLLNKYNIKQPK